MLSRIMSSKKRLIFALLGVVVLVAAVIAYSSIQQSRQAAAAMSQIETVAIKRDKLAFTISATGEVRAAQSVTLNWQTAGTVETVAAQVGDAVKAGAVLARLEQTSLPQSVIVAQAELTEARKALEDLTDNARSARIEAMNRITQYAEQVRDAQYQLDNFTVPTGQKNLSAMQALDQMEEKLDRARQAFEPYKFDPLTDPTRDDLKEKLDNAQSDYNAAVRRVQYEYELEVAKDNLEKAREDYETWKNGPDPDDVTAAEARIAAAQAAVSQAWIEAPIAGVVTLANPLPGDRVTANSAAFRLDDLSTLFVDVVVSEIDVNQVRIGQEVIVTFDAIRGVEYHGKITDVALVGVEQNGVVDFSVTAQLTDPDAAVRPGMTATMEILVAQENDALLLPNQAIQFQDGVQVVYVLKSPGQMTPVEITLGLSSDTQSEVLTGDLKPGDQVVINPPATVTEGQGPGMFGGQMRIIREAESGEDEPPPGGVVPGPGGPP